MTVVKIDVENAYQFRTRKRENRSVGKTQNENSLTYTERENVKSDKNQLLLYPITK